MIQRLRVAVLSIFCARFSVYDVGVILFFILLLYSSDLQS